jgi:hypothetical protein
MTKDSTQAIDQIRARHAGHRCVSIGFMRGGDSREAPTMRLMVQDSEMNLVVLLDMDAKQFADVMSGLNTWVKDGLA